MTGIPAMVNLTTAQQMAMRPGGVWHLPVSAGKRLSELSSVSERHGLTTRNER